MKVLVRRKGFAFIAIVGLLSVTSAFFARVAGLFGIDETQNLPPARSIGIYSLDKLPIYRHLGDGTYQVDASAIIELANQIAVQDESDVVSFNEQKLELTVISPHTVENSRNIMRLWHCIDRMNRSNAAQLAIPTQDTTRL